MLLLNVQFGVVADPRRLFADCIGLYSKIFLNENENLLLLEGWW